MCFLALLVPFFRSRQPNRKKVPKMTSQRPSGTLPGTRQEDDIGLHVALGAFQARFGAPKGGPKWHQTSVKNRPRRPRAPKTAQGPPREPCWSHFGAILESFLEPFWLSFLIFRRFILERPQIKSDYRARLIQVVGGDGEAILNIHYIPSKEYDIGIIYTCTVSCLYI